MDIHQKTRARGSDRPPPAPLPGRSGHVLIVDDEPNVRLVFRTALQSAGYRVSEAGDGQSALKALYRTPIDLILLDLQMPGLGGLDVLQGLRDRGSDVPVVIVTAHGSVPDAVAAMRLGAIDFLSKPLTSDALRATVGNVFRRHAEPAPSEPVVTLGPPAVDLVPAKRALNLRRFDEAERLLREALDLDPGSAEAHTLMGVLHEALDEPHAAYRSYRAALEADADYRPAADSLRLYCERFGLDFRNKAINPGAL